VKRLPSAEAKWCICPEQASDAHALASGSPHSHSGGCCPGYLAEHDSFLLPCSKPIVDNKEKKQTIQGQS